MERYALTTDKDSHITNDPNLWCAEQSSPRYILDLIPRLITLSLQTNTITTQLPALEEL